MLAKVRQTIQNGQLFNPGAKVLVGFSGGIDSVCLLHLLRGLTEYRLDLEAVYINHGLRPPENQQEEQLLQQLGSQWSIPTRIIRLNLTERLRQKPQSLQLLARTERYRIFEELTRELQAERVALGHHRDDQVETILYRLIRGTGLDGLAGMPLIRAGLFVRPFLEVTRAEIQRYATENGLSWVEDSSNQKTSYRRNQIRLQLLPEIKAGFNPRFDEGLLRLAGLAAEQRDLVTAQARQEAERILIPEPDRIGIRLGLFLELHPYLQYYLLKLVLELLSPQHQLESVALLRLRTKLQREQANFRPTRVHHQLQAYYQDGLVLIEKSGPSQTLAQAYYPVALPGRTILTELQLVLEIEAAAPPADWGKVGPNQAYLQLTPADLPLTVRFWQPGEVFWPLGSSGRQKLHDFFIDHKVPRQQRRRVPLLVNAANQVVWVAGHRLDQNFKLQPGVTQCWRATLVAAD